MTVASEVDRLQVHIDSVNKDLLDMREYLKTSLEQKRAQNRREADKNTLQRH